MDVEEDIDYYLAMEEEAQMEEPDFEEGWENAPEADGQQAEAAAPVNESSAEPVPANSLPIVASTMRPTNPAPAVVTTAPKIRYILRST
jgi:hypothetical protein